MAKRELYVFCSMTFNSGKKVIVCVRTKYTILANFIYLFEMQIIYEIVATQTDLSLKFKNSMEIIGMKTEEVK